MNSGQLIFIRNDFIEGAICMSNAVASLFFLRFWKKTGDRLFAIFSLAFLLLVLRRFVHMVLDVPNEQMHYIYLIRLLAYVLIVYAIVDKNRSRGSAPRRG